MRLTSLNKKNRKSSFSTTYNNENESPLFQASYNKKSLNMSNLSSTPGTRGFRIGVVLLLDWLPTKADEHSLPKDMWLFRKSHFPLP